MQHQSPDSPAPQIPVKCRVAVLVVAGYGVSLMLAMDPDLVRATGDQFNPDLTIAVTALQAFDAGQR